MHPSGSFSSRLLGWASAWYSPLQTFLIATLILLVAGWWATTQGVCDPVLDADPDQCALDQHVLALKVMLAAFAVVCIPVIGKRVGVVMLPILLAFAIVGGANWYASQTGEINVVAGIGIAVLGASAVMLVVLSSLLRNIARQLTAQSALIIAASDGTPVRADREISRRLDEVLQRGVGRGSTTYRAGTGSWLGTGLISRAWAMPTERIFNGIANVSVRLAMLMFPFLAMDFLIRNQRVFMSFAVVHAGPEFVGALELDVRPRDAGLVYLDSGQRSERFESLAVEEHFDIQVPDEVRPLEVWKHVEHELLEELARRPGVGVRKRGEYLLAYAEGEAAMAAPLDDLLGCAQAVAAILLKELREARG